MRAVHKPKRKGKVKMSYSAMKGDNVRKYQAGSLGMSSPAKIDRPPAPMPSLSHIQERLEGANNRLAEKVGLLGQMNDRFLGSSPSAASEKMDSGPGVVQQIEYLVMVYEQIITRLSGELERLSCI
jgi:hypothetical protein